MQKTGNIDSLYGYMGSVVIRRGIEQTNMDTPQCKILYQLDPGGIRQKPRVGHYMLHQIETCLRYDAVAYIIQYLLVVFQVLFALWPALSGVWTE